MLAGRARAARNCSGGVGGEAELSRNLCVVNWFNEEGCRFKLSDDGQLRVHRQAGPGGGAEGPGHRRRERARGAGRPRQRGEGSIPEATAYVELHIQQGKSMEEDGFHHWAGGGRRGACEVPAAGAGEQAHTGSTLIEDRQGRAAGASPPDPGAEGGAGARTATTSCGGTADRAQLPGGRCP
ncbi:hypothetical protein QJS66_15055 [Kocuria rhizophila]|nr:hypothetical protein QJS66_15055 [Kocuria rhizophila]